MKLKSILFSVAESVSVSVNKSLGTRSLPISCIIVQIIPHSHLSWVQQAAMAASFHFYTVGNGLQLEFSFLVPALYKKIKGDI